MAVIKSRGVARVQPGNLGGGYLSPSATGREYSEGAEDLKALSDIGMTAASTYIRVANAKLKADNKARDAEARRQANAANDYSAKAAFIKYENDLRKIQSEYQKLRGEEGANIYHEAEKKVMDLKTAYEQQLGNIYQQNTFTTLSVRSTSDTLDRILKHQDEQLKVFDKDLLDATNQNLTEDALFNAFGKDGKIDYKKIAENEVLVGKTTRRAFAPQPKAIRDNKEREARQKYHSEIINMLYTREKYDDAKEYMQVFNKYIDQSYKADMEAKVGDKMFDKEALGVATKIMGEGKGMKHWLQSAETIDDPKMQKEVKGIIKQRDKEYRAAHEQRLDDLAYESWTEIHKHGSLAIKWRNPKLRDSDRRLMEKVVKGLQNPQYDSEIEREAIVELMGMPTAKFTQVDLNKYDDRLSDRRIIELARKQFELRNKKGDENKKTKIQREMSVYQQAESYTRSITDKADQDAFRREIHRAIMAEKLRKGVDDLTVEEVDKLIQDVTRPVEMPTGWFGTSKPTPYYKIYQFEDEAKKDEIRRKAVPPNLSHIKELKYNDTSNLWYLETRVGSSKETVFYDIYGRVVRKVKE